MGFVMLKTKRALITGVTGQDGSLLSSFLLEKGHEVHGLRLYSDVNNTDRIVKILDRDRFHLHYADLTDGGNICRLLSEIQPDEIYNLAAQSHVKVSFEVPEHTADVNGLGVLRILEAIRTLNMTDKVRFYQASSSEMFGSSAPPQNEDTPFHPCSPYGAAKLYAYWITRTYRESYGLHASNGILFNHESPVRGEEFVTRKITRAVAAIEAGMQDILQIGNLDSRRDWGHARDYVEGMWLMLQQDKPDDYVLAAGEAHSVRDFVTAAFTCMGVMLTWQGHGLKEKGIDQRTGRILVAVDPQFFRPNEVNVLRGDARKAHEKLGWKPRVSFAALVQEMLDADRAVLRGMETDDGFLLAAE